LDTTKVVDALAIGTASLERGITNPLLGQYLLQSLINSMVNGLPRTVLPSSRPGNSRRALALRLWSQLQTQRANEDQPRYSDHSADIGEFIVYTA